MSSSSCPLGGGGTPKGQRGGLPNRSRYGSHVLVHERARLSHTCRPSISLPLVLSLSLAGLRPGGKVKLLHSSSLLTAER